MVIGRHSVYAAPAYTSTVLAGPSVVAAPSVYAAPAVVAAPALAGVKSQYHAQDELGQASYGHAEPTQSHSAVQVRRSHSLLKPYLWGLF